MGSISKNNLTEVANLLNEYVARPLPAGETDSLIILDGSSVLTTSSVKSLEGFASFLNSKNNG